MLADRAGGPRRETSTMTDIKVWFITGARPDGNQLLWSPQRDPGDPAHPASAGFRADHHDHVDRRLRRWWLHLGLRRLEARARGMDGVPRAGGRAVRHQDDVGRARLLP